MVSKYWIDLIQARAPGSSILLAATHANWLTADDLQERLKMSTVRRDQNERLRVNELREEMKSCVDTVQLKNLERINRTRPQFHTDLINTIVAFPEVDPTSQSLKQLIGQIALLISPCDGTVSPFRIINIGIPLLGGQSEY